MRIKIISKQHSSNLFHNALLRPNVLAYPATLYVLIIYTVLLIFAPGKLFLNIMLLSLSLLTNSNIKICVYTLQMTRTNQPCNIHTLPTNTFNNLVLYPIHNFIFTTNIQTQNQAQSHNPATHETKQMYYYTL